MTSLETTLQLLAISFGLLLLFTLILFGFEGVAVAFFIASFASTVAFAVSTFFQYVENR